MQARLNEKHPARHTRQLRLESVFQTKPWDDAQDRHLEGLFFASAFKKEYFEFAEDEALRAAIALTDQEAAAAEDPYLYGPNGIGAKYDDSTKEALRLAILIGC